MMLQRFFPEMQRPSDEDMATGLPFYVILYLVMIIVYVIVLVSNPSLRTPGPLALFTALMLAHGILHWFGPLVMVAARQTHRWRWAVAYLAVQGVLLQAIILLTNLQDLTLGLYMALIGEVAGGLWPHLRAIALAVFYCVGLLLFNVAVIWGSEAFIYLLPVLGFMLLFVLTYVILFVRQSEARERAQTLLRELESAHLRLQEYAAQVQELTISQERERMARELHDTLAQGLAGTILQLEAADSHLENGNLDRAQAVVQRAMQRARTTLHEARRAIQALRPTALEGSSLIDALGREVDQFAANTGVHAAFKVDAGPLDVRPDVSQNILRIVQESLTNVARHAQARNVQVRLGQNDEGIQVLIQDDGLGFDPQEGLARPGCFGLAGMKERAQRMGGVLQVESAPGKGTSVILGVEEWKA
jgi:NarL family two-component system sensor histidine kinase YdfH